MCLVIVAHRMSAHYPLLVAANRDEFHARPTQASHFWPEHPQLLAGRDEQMGGTWMGITRQGRFAAITNYRDPERTQPAPRSRGELPLQFLVGSADPRHFIAELATHADEYAGFNLLLGDGRELWYYSNSQPGTAAPTAALAPGIYGLSNAQLDTPWPKSEAGKTKLQALLDAGAVNHDALASVVGARQPAELAALRAQGLDGEMDQLLSAQFIVTEAYGTRSCTSLWLDEQAQVHWREQSFDSAGVLRAEQVQEFHLSA